MADEIIGYREAANILGLPVGTVYSLVSRKKIPHLRLGRRFVRFKKEDLLAWLDAHRVQCDPAPTSQSPEPSR